MAAIARCIAALLTIVGFIYAFYKWSYKKGRDELKNDISANIKGESFSKIYAPLRMALTKTHFVSCGSVDYPRFSDRLKHAYREFLDRKYFKSKLKAFRKALTDKGESISIECDTVFPTKKIKAIVESNPQYADKELIDRIHSLEVVSSTPWDHDEEDIAKCQYDLANYIYKQYDAFHEELHNTTVNCNKEF